jgi:fatty acid desaturase
MNAENVEPGTDTEKAALIRQVVMRANADLRARYPILLHQDAIGASILALCVMGMLGCAYLYFKGWMPWYVCILVSAFFAGVTQEIEHDLIQQLYFRDKRWAYNLMMAAAWLARPNTVNPWFRRRVHAHHHRHSGMDSDFEEQILTNGVPWGLSRLIMRTDLMLSIFFRPIYMFKLMQRYVAAQRVHDQSDRKRLFRDHLSSFFPVGNLYHFLFVSWTIFHTAVLLNGWNLVEVDWSEGVVRAMDVVDFLMVTWLAPNALRIFSLNFVSSNMHYFGDIEPGNVLQQCQVLNTWWLLPFHLFCFNFGGTHGIHHFVVRETFYVRQMTARQAHEVMRRMGVRFNDFGTFQRANRWSLALGRE